MLLEFVKSQSPPLQYAGLETFENKICVSNQSQKQVFAGLTLKIERDTTFIGIVRQPIAAMGMLGSANQRYLLPRRIPRRGFDLNHLGSQVAQDLSAQETERPGQINHPIRFQKQHKQFAFEMRFQNDLCVISSAPSLLPFLITA